MIGDTQTNTRCEQLSEELKFLLTRAKVSITCSVLSLLFVSTLVLSLFFMALLDVDLSLRALELATIIA